MYFRRYTQRLARVERTLQPAKVVIGAVLLIGEDEPEPPCDTGERTIHITLGTPFEKADEGR